MASSEIPAQLLVKIDDAEMKALMLNLWPSGPPPAPAPVSGAVLSYRSALFDPGHSIPAGASFLDSPCFISVTPQSATSRFVIEFSGRFGASILSIIGIALKRDTTLLPLPSGAEGLDAPRIDAATDSTYFGSFKVEDRPNTIDEITYRVVARNRNGTGYFGRRGFDQTMNTPLFMAITEYAG